MHARVQSFKLQVAAAHPKKIRTSKFAKRYLLRQEHVDCEVLLWWWMLFKWLMTFSDIQLDTSSCRLSATQLRVCVGLVHVAQLPFSTLIVIGGGLV